MIKLIAFDLDGTLTQHKTKLSDEHRAVLREAPSSDMMKKYLESVELDISEFEKLYGKDKIDNAIFYAKDLKDRYTVLWLYYLLAM